MDATWSTGSPLATAEAVPVWSSGSPLATVPEADDPDPEGIVWSSGSPRAAVTAHDPETGRVAVELPVSWDVRARVAPRDLTLGWSVRTSVTTDLGLHWTVRTPVHTTLTLSWDVHADDTAPIDGVDLTVTFGAPTLTPQAGLGQPQPAPLVRAGPPADTPQAHLRPPSAPRRILAGPPTI